MWIQVCKTNLINQLSSQLVYAFQYQYNVQHMVYKLKSVKTKTKQKKMEHTTFLSALLLTI